MASAMKVPILLELVEIELDVVDPIDGTESLSLDHLQCLYEWLQSGIGSENPHLFQLLKIKHRKVRADTKLENKASQCTGRCILVY